MAVVTGNGLNNLLSGTNGDDLIQGLGGDDSLFGSRGNDVLDGGTGDDTANYGSFNRAITLQAQGAIDKGNFGTDQIIGIENIVGAIGKRNAIDGFVLGGGPARFEIDLSSNDLAVFGIPGIGVARFDIFNFLDATGTSNDDLIVGNGSDNVFTGSLGDDTYNGKGGRDTLSYKGLGQAVTLERAGTINKGTAGTDQIENIQTIIGDRGFANAIDGGTGISGTTAFNLDLSANSLLVRGIPGIGARRFTVENFVNVTGTSNSDQLTGDRKNNVFGGSFGNDKINGGNGRDTVDYSDLGEAIRLDRAGLINKGAAGNDRITGIETIIGATGERNSINGNSAGSSGVTAFNVNLKAERLIVKNIPGLGNRSFTVKNFVDVTGTVNNDSLIGDDGNNTLNGFAGRDRLKGGDGDDSLLAGTGRDQLFGEGGNDRLRGGEDNDLLNGGAGDDVLIGVGTETPAPGAGEVDRLIGGAGADKFVLGDDSNIFYKDAGNADFANIADFETGIDKIVLSGSLGSYSFDAANRRIFVNEPGGTELIARTNTAFNVNTDFSFV